MFNNETLGGPQQMEDFPITVEELRSHFEALGGKKVSAWAKRTPQGNGDGPQGCRAVSAASHRSSPVHRRGWAVPATVPVDVLWTIWISTLTGAICQPVQ